MHIRSLAVLTAMTLPSAALAQPLAPGETPIAEPVQEQKLEVQPAPPTSEAWDAQWAAADLRMQEGKFAEAMALFAELASNASTSDQRIRAQEAKRIAAYLNTNFMPTAQTSNTIPNLSNRTTGELANLYVSSIFYGAGSGIVVGIHTDSDSAATIVLPILGLAGASAGIVAALDGNLELGYGVPQSISTGMWLGLYEGFALTYYHFASTSSDNEWSDETISKVIWGGATLGAITGGIVGQQWGTTPGRASLLGTNGLWGGLTLGLLALGISDGTGDSDEGFFGAAALGIAGGALLGGFQGRNDAPSLARVRFLDLGGLSGGLLLGGLALATEPDRTETVALATGVGIAAGYLTAYFATAGMEPDPGSKQDVATMVPSIAPTSDGSGMTVGFAGTL